jgi:hypothetical protein
MPRPATTAPPLDADILADDATTPDDSATNTAIARRGAQHQLQRQPTTLHELAALRSDALEVLETRLVLLETARKRSIRLTSPPDWSLSKAIDGTETGYLSDDGCDRVRPVLGIEIFNVSKHEKIESADGSCMYLIRGSGYCRDTNMTVEDVEGGRATNERFFARDSSLTGLALHLKVRKSARANLDGRIVRELAGLNRVAIEELRDAWVGTDKSTDQCARTHGYGSVDERHGGTREGAPDVEPPTCTVCKRPDGTPLPLKWRENKRFYGCANYDRHPQVKVTVDGDTWIAQQKKKHASAPAPDAAAAADIEDAKRQDAELAQREAKHGR